MFVWGEEGRWEKERGKKGRREDGKKIKTRRVSVCFMIGGKGEERERREGKHNKEE